MSHSALHDVGECSMMTLQAVGDLRRCGKHVCRRRTWASMNAHRPPKGQRESHLLCHFLCMAVCRLVEKRIPHPRRTQKGPNTVEDLGARFPRSFRGLSDGPDGSESMFSCGAVRSSSAGRFFVCPTTEKPCSANPWLWSGFCSASISVTLSRRFCVAWNFCFATCSVTRDREIH
jgi:hypothetical protein